MTKNELRDGLKNYKTVVNVYTNFSLFVDITTDDKKHIDELFTKLKEYDIGMYEYLNILIDSIQNIKDLRIIFYLGGIKLHIVKDGNSYLTAKVFFTTEEKSHVMKIERKIESNDREQYLLDIIQTLNVAGLYEYDTELTELIGHLESDNMNTNYIDTSGVLKPRCEEF